jgi:hypothetical protein
MKLTTTTFRGSNGFACDVGVNGSKIEMRAGQNGNLLELSLDLFTAEVIGHALLLAAATQRNEHTTPNEVRPLRDTPADPSAGRGGGT